MGLSVVADPPARAVLADLGRRLRAAGYTTAPSPDIVVRLARGERVDRRDVVDSLGADGLDAALHAGVLVDVPTGDGGAPQEVALSGMVFPMRSLLTWLPRNEEGEDVVYIGPDSIALLDVVWRRCGAGGYAADLATGNGFIAAALATRFEHVVATDLSSRCVAAAALLPVLNPHLAGRISALRLDVAAGLRQGQFDVVVANPPWVPETAGPDGGAPRLFAAGGETGYELPRRFVEQALDLLAPGGQAFIGGMDIGFVDGQRPMIDHATGIGERGFDVEVVPTGLSTPEHLQAWARGRHPGARTARHVVLVIRRPNSSPN